MYLNISFSIAIRILIDLLWLGYRNFFILTQHYTHVLRLTVRERFIYLIFIILKKSAVEEISY